ncbi:hypothetical protein D3C72_1307120 [compost metagenome]
MVAVADREGIGQRELERNVLAHVEAHRRLVLELDPAVHLSLVPRGLLVGEIVRRAGSDQCVADSGVAAEGQDVLAAVGVRLEIHRLAVGQRNREAVAEAAHAAQRAEVVVEAAVLLHQDHDVLDVLDGAGVDRGLDGERLADRGRQQGQGRGRADGAGRLAEEIATVGGVHGESFNARTRRKEMEGVWIKAARGSGRALQRRGRAGLLRRGGRGRGAGGRQHRQAAATAASAATCGKAQAQEKARRSEAIPGRT